MILSDDEVLHAWDDDPTWFRSKFKTSHLEANARIRELEAIAEWHDILVNSDSYFRDRADRLAVVADALAEEVEGLLLSCADDLEAANYWCDRADRAEAKLRELAEAAEGKDWIETLAEPDHFPAPENPYDFQDAKYRIWERYQAALEAAKEVR